MNIGRLKHIAVTAGFGALTTGCSTIAIPTGPPCHDVTAVVAPGNLGAVSKQEYKPDCGTVMLSTEMIKSGNPAFMAAGTHAAGKVNPLFKASVDQTVDRILNPDLIEYVFRKQPDGSFKVVPVNGLGLITVPGNIAKAADKAIEQFATKTTGAPAAATSASAPQGAASAPAPAPAGP